MNQDNSSPNQKPQDLIESALKALRSRYVVVGTKHIPLWKAGLLVGLVVGVAAGILLVANWNGKFLPSEAMDMAKDVPLTGPVQQSSQTSIQEQGQQDIRQPRGLPLPANAFCFYSQYSGDPRCRRYYQKDEFGSIVRVCPKYFNPVFSPSGIFYPSACWAEALGARTYQYGYSPRLRDFFREQWAKEGMSVPIPNIEFTYTGSGLGHDGTWLRSSFWHDSQTVSWIDYYIATVFGNYQFTPKYTWKMFYPVIGVQVRVLVVFVEFDPAYPHQLLLDSTQSYGNLMNDYIRKKQQVPAPAQYVFTPVVIPPPPGVQRITASHWFFDDTELQLIYNTATQLVGSQVFEAFVVAPIQIGGLGGSYTFWNNLHLIVAPLTPPAPFSFGNPKEGLDALSAFHDMFTTFSHEMLHSFGLLGDHMPMEYGTYFLDPNGGALTTDPITGKSVKPSITSCDFFGGPSDFYAVELPPGLTVKVGAEPPGLVRIPSASGDCAGPLYYNGILKDSDGDGEYEIIHKNNLIGIELQRNLGWADVDGDGIAELIDPTPYGGASPSQNRNQ